MAKTPFQRIFRQVNSTQFLSSDLKGKKVLDVGCGTGAQLESFADQGCICIGLDLTRESLQQLQRRKGNAIVADACHLPFKTDCFNIVFSNEFYSHVADFALAFNEQVRVLQRKGQLLIRDSNLLCPITLFDLLILYPVRTRGKYGGLKWLFTHNSTVTNAYDSRFSMKDENVKTLSWWKKQVRQQQNVTLRLATTSYVDRLPKSLTHILGLFAGQNVIVAIKD